MVVVADLLAYVFHSLIIVGKWAENTLLEEIMDGEGIILATTNLGDEKKWSIKRPFSLSKFDDVGRT